MTLDAKCRGCQAPIVWARHAGSGKLAPFNSEPSQLAGTFELDEQPDGSRVAVYSADSLQPRYVPHHATCPKVDLFRRPTGG